MESYWIIYTISYCYESLCFLRSDVIYCSHIGFHSILCFFFVENELYCVSYCMFSHSWYRRTGSLHIELVHIRSSILNRSVCPNIYLYFVVGVICNWFHFDGITIMYIHDVYLFDSSAWCSGEASAYMWVNVSLLRCTWAHSFT